MGYELTQQAYAQSVGTSPTNYPWIDTRNPTVNDIYYPIGKWWINTANLTLWYLNSQNTTSGYLQSVWLEVSAVSILDTISDTANTPVPPSSSSDIPPNNIQLVGGAGITVVSNPGSHLLTISATGAGTVESFAVDAFTAPGTNPVLPTAGGLVTVTGGQVAAGTTANVIRTDSLAANTYAIQIQRSQAVASSTIGDNGVSHFNSAQFTVDANGFVSLIGGSAALENINVQTGTSPVVPTSGSITFNGAVVAAGTHPVRTDGTGASTMALEVQIAQAIPSTNATNIGLSAFNSAQFTVDGNGFVSTSGTGVLNTLTGNTGGAISPVAGNINTVGTGSITIAGAGNTLTTQLTGLTNHAVLVGAGTPTITSVGPSSATGQVLQNNVGADPSYSTATYPSTTTINQILYSSANNVVSGLTTANNGVLTTGTTGTPVITALSANGQLIIGSGSGAPLAATLTAGTGITITNAANSITIASTGGGFTWTDVTTATQALLVENGYVTDRGAGVTYTLPATAALGDEIIILGKLGLTTIAQNAGQQITMSSSSSTVGVTGSVAGTNVGDCITLRCITPGASTIWRAESFVGNWTIT